MNITRGIRSKAQKVVAYGPEGIGKTNLGSQFPNVLFIDTEESTNNIDVARLDKPTSWTMLLNQISWIKANPTACSTLAIDTADWAERLVKEHLMAVNNWKAIDSSDYGIRYVALENEWGNLLNKLSELVDIGINVFISAHAQIKKFEQPDEIGAYDRWELKLEKKTAAITKEWADMVLFLNYKTYVVTDDKTKSKKAQGGQRVMYTSHHPAWDAKNRHGLEFELPLNYSSLAHIFNKQQAPAPIEPVTEQAIPVKEVESIEQAPQPEVIETPPTTLPQALVDLMAPEKVTEEEIQIAVSGKGYYPADVPVSDYDPAFIQGVLIAAWPQVFSMIQADRELPF